MMTYFYSQDRCCLGTYYSSSCMYSIQCGTRRCMFNYFFKVSHYNVGCCASLYGLLPTQKGRVSTQEFVKRTDRVPHMSALLLFNITTEHTLNSRHGAVPFDMEMCTFFALIVMLNGGTFLSSNRNTLCFKGICSLKTED